MTNTQTEKPLHAFSGILSPKALFRCSECYQPMHCDEGGDWSDRSCSHTKLSVMNPIINWENVDDWSAALVANFSLGQGDHLSDARRLSMFLVQHSQIHSDLSRIQRIIYHTNSIPYHVLDKAKLKMLERSMHQKVSRIQSMIQFGVNA